jgi:hypothetical protein
MKILVRLMLTTALTALVFGQEARETVTADIGGKKVTIEYGRPVLKGRSVSEMMTKLPGDRMWRAGAGKLTTLTTETDLTIGGKKVPAGTYSLYLHCPESGDYSLVINRDLGQPLSKLFPAAPPERANQLMPSFDYTKEVAAKEVARIPLKQASAPKTDMFTFQLKPSGKGATLVISWGEQAWSTEIDS